MIDAEDSIIFLEFLRDNGFNVEDYSSILEIFNNVEFSMAKFLRAYQVYLLSSKVTYKDLINFNIKGANGYIKDKEIYVPSNMVNDMLFNKKNKYYYHHPLIDSFDCIIGCGISNEIDELPNKSMFIGDIYRKDSPYVDRVFDRYKALASKMGYEYIEGEFSHLNKTMCLVKHKI